MSKEKNDQQNNEKNEITAIATKTTSRDLFVPENFAGAFSPEEALGGLDPVNTGYVDQYPFFVHADANQFVVTTLDAENNRSEIARIEKKLEAVIIYAHHVYRLRAGVTAGKTERESWSDEDKKIVAQTYSSPFRGELMSRGNFDANGFGQYLDNPELRKLLDKRLYIIAKLLGFGASGEYALISLGSSAMMPFDSYRRFLQKNSLPIGAVKTEIELIPAKNDAGKSFFQPTFHAQNNGGKIAMFFPSPDAYRAKMLPVIEAAKKLHAIAIRGAEEHTIAPVRSHDMQVTISTDTDRKLLGDDEIPF